MGQHLNRHDDWTQIGMLTQSMAWCGHSLVLNTFCHINIFICVLSHVTFYNCRHNNDTNAKLVAFDKDIAIQLVHDVIQLNDVLYGGVSYRILRLIHRSSRMY